MKTIKFLTIAIILIFTFSCEDDNNIGVDTISITVEDLHAPLEGGQGQSASGPFTKFNFEDGIQTSSETNWDIAFRGTSIIVNGGISMGTEDEPERNGNGAAYIFEGTMNEMEIVETSFLVSDSQNSYSGPPNHLINPTPGKILVFRTHNNKFAKVEILSYYLGAPENPDALSDQSRYYTFNYVYQPNEGATTFD